MGAGLLLHSIWYVLGLVLSPVYESLVIFEVVLNTHLWNWLVCRASPTWEITGCIQCFHLHHRLHIALWHFLPGRVQVRRSLCGKVRNYAASVFTSPYII